MTDYNRGILAAAEYIQTLANNAEGSPAHRDLVQMFRDMAQEIEKLREAVKDEPSSRPFSPTKGTKAS